MLHNPMDISGNIKCGQAESCKNRCFFLSASIAFRAFKVFIVGVDAQKNSAFFRQSSIFVNCSS